MAQLSASNLVKRYKGREVVNGISLTIEDHSIVGLLGPNGAGKTTTFYMIAGMIAPDEGSIQLNGEDITPLPMYKRAIMGLVYLPQEYSVFRKLTVAQNIELVLEARGLSKQETKQRTAELLIDMGLSHLADQKAAYLSGGERRRLEVIRALAVEPEFILLDEPFAGVDPLSIVDLQEMVKGLKKMGIGIFISDHNVRETLTVCDRAYIVNNGSIVVEGTPEEILKSSVARKVYLGEDFSL